VSSSSIVASAGAAGKRFNWFPSLLGSELPPALSFSACRANQNAKPYHKPQALSLFLVVGVLDCLCLCRVGVATIALDAFPQHPTYLQKLGDRRIDNHQRSVDQMDHSVAHWDVGLDNLGQNHSLAVLGIAHNGVGLYVHCNGYIIGIHK